VGDARSDDLAGSILDGEPIDWAVLESSAEPDEDSLVPYLRTVARIAHAYRGDTDSLSSAATYAPSTPDVRSSSPPPARWGHLRLLERIGRGAFGEVYRAWDSKLDREVALKLLPEQPAQRDRGTAIIEEGRLLARVRHPNVVTIYGADRVDNRVGLWMELIDGETLQQALDRGRRFSVRETIDVGIEVAGAMAAVHDAGLLHRDVKPHNLMLAADGRVVLMDFGTGHDRRSGDDAVLSGTPLYLAPELLAGGGPSVASDIYSLGVVLFYQLARSYPVSGNSLMDLRAAHERRTRADIRLLRPDVPRRLAALINRALHPAADQRQPTAQAIAVELTAVRRWLPPRMAYAAAAAVLVIAALAAAVTLRRDAVAVGDSAPAAPAHAAVPPVAQRPVIAVLPLENLNAGTENEDFADGLTDEIIRNLAVIDGLEVRSRTSSFSFKDTPRNLVEVGERLRANLVVEGSVFRSGNRIRINAQLVGVTGDTPLWSERFDRDITDIFAIQDEISRAIVNNLRLTLGRGQRRYNTHASTYELYLRAQAINYRRGTANAQHAAELFREVLTRDPSFAPAHAGLAIASEFMSRDYFGLDDEAGLLQMRPAAARALDLDPLLAEAHAAMALVHARQREWADAERRFQRALELNPSLTSTHTMYVSATLMPIGKLDEAVRILEAAKRADPLSLDVQRYEAILSIVRGRYDDAIVTLRKIRAEDPTFQFVDLHLARALTFAGRLEEAMPLWEERERQVRARNADVRGVQYWSALAYVQAGRREDVKRWAVGQDAFAFRQAVIHAALGDETAALEALNRAVDTVPQRVPNLLMSPEMAALRDDPRYAALRQRLNLP
jgi:eukaryotic-like serine/threonine-protein kinase